MILYMISILIKNQIAIEFCTILERDPKQTLTIPVQVVKCLEVEGAK